MKNNYHLLLSATIAVVILLLLSSCGTRKTDISYQKQFKDSITIENHYTQATKTVLMDIFTAKPIDALKPMWIDGKEYRNAVISNDKSKIETKYFKITEKQTIYKTIVIEKNKTTTRTDNTMLWLGMFLIVVVAVFFWFYLPKLKTGI